MDRLQVFSWPLPGLCLAPFYHLSSRCHRPPRGIMTGPVMNCGLSYLVRREAGEKSTLVVQYPIRYIIVRLKFCVSCFLSCSSIIAHHLSLLSIETIYHQNLPRARKGTDRSLCWGRHGDRICLVSGSEYFDGEDDRTIHIQSLSLGLLNTCNK